MWRALRAELAYFRPWLLGGLGIAAAVTILISLVFYFVGDGPEIAIAAALRGFFPVIAGMVVGFIAQALRSEENRARLLLAGPLTPRQLAGVLVLLPVVLCGVGVVAAGLVVGAEYLITGRLYAKTIRTVGGIVAMMFAIGQMGPLVQESTVARRQSRPRATVIGWSCCVVAVVLLNMCQFYLGTIYGNLAMVLVVVAVAAVSWWLYTDRNDFT